MTAGHPAHHNNVVLIGNNAYSYRVFDKSYFLLIFSRRQRTSNDYQINEAFGRQQTGNTVAIL